MSKPKKVLRSTDDLIKERKEKRRLKGERFIAKLEKIEQRKERIQNHIDANGTLQPAKKGRLFTISIALPCSILDECQSQEIKCYLVATVARAAAIFGVEEIIIFNDTNAAIPSTASVSYNPLGKRSHSAWVMASMLQYIECPPHLRKLLFPLKKEFEAAANMTPLDIPHHQQDHPLYREGIVSDKSTKSGQGSYINIGSQQLIWVDRPLGEKIRVTVKLAEKKEGEKKLRGTVVSPYTPRLESSIYWGYSVRVAKNFGDVFTGNTSGWKYDLTVGTSDKGDSVETVQLAPFEHLLVVFGGANGIESCIECDETLKASDPMEMFNFYLNTCPNQGSRTIRTEEAVFITLSALQPKFPC